MTKSLKAIMVDDEASAHENLSALLTRFCPEVEIIGMATHVEEAWPLIQKSSPDLVFLDIEMPGKSGFDLINTYTTINFHIIFVTAYDRYALKAFEVSAIDYLLKPVVVTRLQEAVHKVILQKKRQNYELRFEALQTNTQSNTFKKLAIPHRNDYVIINIKDIICIEADRMYSKIFISTPHHKKTTHYLYAKKLSYFENLFEQLPNFHRVHRSWIINSHHIHSYSKKDRNIALKNDTTIPVSKSYKEALEAFLGF